MSRTINYKTSSSLTQLFLIKRGTFLKFFCLLGTFWKYIYIIFKDKKSKKKTQSSMIQGFSYYFCLVIEGSGSGSIPLTTRSGSGSRRPRNMWIRIHNTGFFYILLLIDSFWPGSGLGSAGISIDLAPRIRIRSLIEIKSWMRIHNTSLYRNLALLNRIRNNFY
jgi:hypothetical protein